MSFMKLSFRHWAVSDECHRVLNIILRLSPVPRSFTLTWRTILISPTLLDFARFIGGCDMRAQYRCVVKEHASGLPFLGFEVLSGDEPEEIKGKQLTLYLHAGTSFEAAHKLAREINRLVGGLSIS